MALIKIVEQENKAAEKPKYEPIPEGGYEVYVDRVNDVTEFEGVEKGSFMLRVRDDVDGDHPNRTLFVNITTAENLAWKLSNIATAAGIPAGTDFTNLTEYLDAIHNKSMKVIVTQREYNGKVYNDVKAFYPTRLKPYAVLTDGPDLDLV